MINDPLLYTSLAGDTMRIAEEYMRTGSTKPCGQQSRTCGYLDGRKGNVEGGDQWTSSRWMEPGFL
eukprot:4367627-Pyramimonas_sp.AAC.1